MNQSLNKIVIVGGGTAGWMTAAYLKKVFGHTVEITLVESPAISTVGVGEATFSTIKVFFDFLELDEKDWMPECSGSYKLAIRYENWNAEGRHFYHPFQRHEIVNGFHIGEWWLKHRDELPAYDYSCFTVPALCDAKRSPRFLDGGVYDMRVEEFFKPDVAFRKNVLTDLKIQYPYAYHFNAGQLAKFLCRHAVRDGVTHIQDDVLEIKRSGDGNIASIVTKNGVEVKGDLFIDCTGFKGMLINQTLKEPFQYFSESLFCDSALAMQVPRNIERDGMKPYTTSTALGSGWVWNIPLYGRDGTGYVFASNFISPAEAEKEFRKHVGSAGDNCNVSLIKMRIGRNRNAWVNNCVAIGLANAFVEPLESTGIFFIQQAIEELVASFPDRRFDPRLMQRYNTNIAECIDGVKDFLTLHYSASTRYDTPFWKATKHELKLPEDLRERMTEWKTRLPNSRNINLNYHGFESYSYAVMLQGLGFLPERNLPVLDHIDSTAARTSFAEIRRRSEFLCRELPSLYEYLTSLRTPVQPVEMITE